MVTELIATVKMAGCGLRMVAKGAKTESEQSIKSLSSHQCYSSYSGLSHTSTIQVDFGFAKVIVL